MLYAPWLLITAEIQHGLVLSNLQAAATSAYKLTTSGTTWPMKWATDKAELANPSQSM